jgi:hypothetical protein
VFPQFSGKKAFFADIFGVGRDVLYDGQRIGTDMGD